VTGISVSLAGLRAKSPCRCVKFHGDDVLCRRRTERQAPRANFASPESTAALGPGCSAHVGEHTGSAARRFCLVGLRHCLADPHGTVPPRKIKRLLHRNLLCASLAPPLLYGKQYVNSANFRHTCSVSRVGTARIDAVLAGGLLRLCGSRRLVSCWARGCCRRA